MSPEQEERHDEDLGLWWLGGWISPLLAFVFTLGWLLMIYGLIGTRPVRWQYGVIPFVPGESIFSTEEPRPGPVPKQVVLPVRDKGGKRADR